jgi:hypothetical protein
METGNEIKGAINNIRYYSERIHELARQQFQKDFDVGTLVGMEPEPGTIRFDCLGAIDTATRWLLIYCEHIEANLKYAEEQDKKLRPFVEKSKETQESLPF